MQAAFNRAPRAGRDAGREGRGIAEWRMIGRATTMWRSSDEWGLDEGVERLSILKDLVRDDYSTVLDEEELGIGIVRVGHKVSKAEMTRAVRRQTDRA